MKIAMIAFSSNWHIDQCNQQVSYTIKKYINSKECSQILGKVLPLETGLLKVGYFDYDLNKKIMFFTSRHE